MPEIMAIAAPLQSRNQKSVAWHPAFTYNYRGAATLPPTYLAPAPIYNIWWSCTMALVVGSSAGAGMEVEAQGFQQSQPAYNLSPGPLPHRTAASSVTPHPIPSAPFYNAPIALVPQDLCPIYLHLSTGIHSLCEAATEHTRPSYQDCLTSVSKSVSHFHNLWKPHSPNHALWGMRLPKDCKNGAHSHSALEVSFSNH